MQYETADSTAQAGVDYEASSGTLSFPPGETEQFVQLSVLPDDEAEGDEWLRLHLLSDSLVPSSDVTLIDAEGVGLIVDDDVPPVEPVRWTNPQGSLAPFPPVAGHIKKQGASGWNAGASSIQSFTGYGYVTFTPTASKDLAAGLSRTDTSTSPDEIAFAFELKATGAVRIKESGTYLVIDGDKNVSSYAPGEPFRILRDAAGQVHYFQGETLLHTSAGGTADALIVDVSLSTKGAELVNVNLAHAGAAGGGAGAQARLSIGDANLLEGDTGRREARFEVTLSPPQASEVRVPYLTSDETAAGGVDYENAQGELVFGPGQTTRTLSVPVVGDVEQETDERFQVHLSDPSGIQLADGVGVGRIRDDDTPVQAIDWVRLVNTRLSPDGELVKRKRKGSGWNAGASSAQAITGSGCVEIQIQDGDTRRVVGLSHADTMPGLDDIAFGFELDEQQRVRIWEGGTLVSQDGETLFARYRVGERLRIEATAATIRYLHEGRVLREVPRPGGALHVDASIYTPGGVIAATLGAGP